MTESVFSSLKYSPPVVSSSVLALHSSGGAKEGPVADAEREGEGSGSSPTGGPGRRRCGSQPATTHSSTYTRHHHSAPPHHNRHLRTQEETRGGEGDGVVGKVQEEEDDLDDEHQGEQEGHQALLYLQDAL